MSTRQYASESRNSSTETVPQESGGTKPLGNTGQSQGELVPVSNTVWTDRERVKVNAMGQWLKDWEKTFDALESKETDGKHKLE
ncbi:MAG: hypothetical protein M1835_000498, partial [Candelina submexicana]